ncbi:MAG: 4-hydroxybenzoate 3-monooxygenase [Rhodospirillales bacterium]
MIKAPAHRMKTTVGIIGGGPAGLLLSHLLDRAGVDSVILERQTRAYVLSRIRAGVLEQGTCDLLRAAGLGDRLDQEGLRHSGVNLAFQGKVARIDLETLTGGKVVTVYGQTKVTEDLYNARDSAGARMVHEAKDVQPHDIETESPYLTFEHEGLAHRLDCDFIASCDGHHGIGRQMIPSSSRNEFELQYPFGWIGVLAKTPPPNEELIYASHQRGFVLCSMRSETISRYYLQAALQDTPEDWPDDRFWDELKQRLPSEVSATVIEGPSIEKSMTPLRSFVSEPLSHGRMFLAGDAGHIVPPTGAKGLNLAVSDVKYLSDALIAYYRHGDETGLKSYDRLALSRVWKAARFSWHLTTLMHHFPDEGAFREKVQKAELDYLVGSKAAMTAFAENYVGLPL